jgi:hypothetical protein
MILGMSHKTKEEERNKILKLNIAIKIKVQYEQIQKIYIHTHMPDECHQVTVIKMSEFYFRLTYFTALGE